MKNLSEVKGTVANVVVASMNKINEAYNNIKVTLEEFKNIILKIVDTARATTARARIINNIKQKKSKTDLIYYIYNSVLCADNLGSIA